MYLHYQGDFYDLICSISNSNYAAKVLKFAMESDLSNSYYKDTFPNYIKTIEKNPKNVTYLDDKKDSMILSSTTYTSKKRRTTKIGRLIKKIFTEQCLSDYNVTDKVIEDFVNAYASIFKGDNESLGEVKGKEIAWAYHEKNYYEQWGHNGVLWGSCMKQEERNKFFGLYSKNTDICSMLVMLKDNKVAGRALLWNFKDAVTKKKVKIMDRIYYIRDFDQNKFKEWAKKNGYLYKKQQSYSCDDFVDPKTSKMTHRTFAIPIKNIDHGSYPYLDTFFYLDHKKGILSNNSKYNLDCLRQTGGTTENRVRDLANKNSLIHRKDKDIVQLKYRSGYTLKKNTVKSKADGVQYLKKDTIRSKVEKDWIYKPDSVISKFAESVLSKKNSKRSKYLNDFIPEADAVELAYRKDWGTKESTIKCKIDGKHMVKGDTVVSKYHKCRILGVDAVEVDGDLIHKDHIVYSHYEKKDMISSKSRYIIGVGYVSNERHDEALENGMVVEADEMTEYDMRMQEQE